MAPVSPPCHLQLSSWEQICLEASDLFLIRTSDAFSFCIGSVASLEVYSDVRVPLAIAGSRYSPFAGLWMRDCISKIRIAANVGSAENIRNARCIICQ